MHQRAGAEDKNEIKTGVCTSEGGGSIFQWQTGRSIVMSCPIQLHFNDWNKAPMKGVRAYPL